MELTGTRWSLLAQDGAYWYKMELTGTRWSLLAQDGAYWHKMELTGTRWSLLAQDGAYWHKMAVDVLVLQHWAFSFGHVSGHLSVGKADQVAEMDG